ncbi:hypothetical protein GCM10017581_010240 [Dactylosporangium matsuzakiense]|uniref:Uncharacterized protein n=1 Tax=Dactylosporangium matsuzakiense TaxID=53360 RepID=A0A9W6KEL2_9ACTN|nr:hypothetical protein GCM10017581_010240 [Dactylosporangium matsuzakiense]
MAGCRTDGSAGLIDVNARTNLRWTRSTLSASEQVVVVVDGARARVSKLFAAYMGHAIGVQVSSMGVRVMNVPGELVE